MQILAILLGAVWASIGPALSSAALHARPSIAPLSPNANTPSYHVQSPLGKVIVRSISQASEGVCPRTHGAEWLGLAGQFAAQSAFAAVLLALAAVQFAHTVWRYACSAVRCCIGVVCIVGIAGYAMLATAIGACMAWDRIRYGPRTSAEVLALMRKAHCKGVPSAGPESPRIRAALPAHDEPLLVC